MSDWYCIDIVSRRISVFVTHGSYRVKGSRILKKFITFHLGNYLYLWVTFDVFTCKRMIKLKIASKRSELHCNWVSWLIWKLEHLVNTPQLAILLMIKVCWSNWNVSPHAGTIHMTCTVICYEITLEKCICVSRSILSSVPLNNKNEWFPLTFGRSYGSNWPFLPRCIGSDDCNVYLLAFKLSNFQLCINCNCLPYLFLKSWSRWVNNLTSFVWNCVTI